MSDKKTKFKKTRRKSESSTTSSFSSEEEIDSHDLKPIKDYLSDREELTRQLFKSVKPEKLRMMLPQVLKKMDLGELQEWCASELSGMSRTRIMAILSGKPMAESSDTDDSDDSGPSLEIISDTEAWLTDEDTIKKEHDASSTAKKTAKPRKDKGARARSKSQSQKPSDKEKTAKSRTRGRHKPLAGEARVKKEGEKATDAKEKEGDSLLDLLELEMRARAIRALIRKEEDVIPADATSVGNAAAPTSGISAREKNLTLKTVEDKLKEIDKSFRQAGGLKPTSAEDEDVVLVVQPTPTIELLSSESEGEDQGGARRNQRLENERVGNGKTENVVAEGTTARASGEPATNGATEGRKESDKVTEKSASKPPRSEAAGVADKKSSGKRTRKKQQLKDNSNNGKSSENTEKRVEAIARKSAEEEHSRDGSEKKEGDGAVTANREGEPEESRTDDPAADKPEHRAAERKREDSRRETTEEDKSADLELIIDLDDYPDDLDDTDTGEDAKIAAKPPEKEETAEESGGGGDKATSSETWATRYYQTDDVQSVIKQSKIQSEIRKRLRERQRLARLTNSPNRVATPATATTTTEEKTEKSETTGSVEEYLALKSAAPESPVASNGNASGKSDAAKSEETEERRGESVEASVGPVQDEGSAVRVEDGSESRPESRPEASNPSGGIRSIDNVSADGGM